VLHTNYCSLSEEISEKCFVENLTKKLVQGKGWSTLPVGGLSGSINNIIWVVLNYESFYSLNFK